MVDSMRVAELRRGRVSSGEVKRHHRRLGLRVWIRVRVRVRVSSESLWCLPLQTYHRLGVCTHQPKYRERALISEIPGHRDLSRLAYQGALSAHADETPP